MKKYQVYGIGNALVDNDYEVDENFLEEFSIKKNSHELIDEAHRLKLFRALGEKECTRNCGGSAGNTIMILSQFGESCFYSCRLGHDLNGQFYKAELKKNGIDNPYIQKELTSDHTGTCFVLVTPDGHRSLQTHLGATETLSTNELNDDAIKNSEYVYIEGFIAAQPSAHQAALQVMHIAKYNQVKVAMTLSDVFMTTHFRRELAQLLEQGVDLLFCNEDEALSYTNQNNIVSALEHLKEFSRQVVITRAEKGSIVNDGISTYEVPAVKTHVVDTVGAGDVYAGTFLHAICQQHDFETAAKMASYAAAQIINKFTARFTQEEFDEVNKHLKSQLAEKITE